MTPTEIHLRAWADQAIRPVIREILRDELADIIPTLLSPNKESDSEPFGNFSWLTSTCSGIPVSTLRQWDAAGKIPGSTRFGKRKLYEKQIVLDWLRSGASQSIDTSAIEQATDAQINRQLSKTRKGALVNE